MDYDCLKNDAGTNAVQSETDGHFRVSFESPKRANDGRLMYFENQLQFPNPELAGPLADWSPDEARAVFRYLLDWTGVCSSWDWPLPPAGLPGFLHSGYCKDDLEAKLLEIGIRYVYAVVNNERRAMHNRWSDAAELIHKIEAKAEERVYLEQARQAMEECDARDATPSFVYFIGAQSGPIKIGIAVRPQDRLKGLQTGHHERLELLATCSGGAQQERAYHKQFKSRRLNGEWFERCAEIEAEIERLNA